MACGDDVVDGTLEANGSGHARRRLERLGWTVRTQPVAQLELQPVTEFDHVDVGRCGVLPDRLQGGGRVTVGGSKRVHRQCGRQRIPLRDECRESRVKIDVRCVGLADHATLY